MANADGQIILGLNINATAANIQSGLNNILNNTKTKQIILKTTIEKAETEKSIEALISKLSKKTAKLGIEINAKDVHSILAEQQKIASVQANLNRQMQEYRTIAKDIGITLNKNTWNSFNHAIKTEDFAKARDIIKSAKQQIDDYNNSIKKMSSDTSVSGSVSSIVDKFRSLKNVSEETQRQLSQLKAALTRFEKADTEQKKVRAYEILRQRIAMLTNEYNRLSNIEKSDNADTLLRNKIKNAETYYNTLKKTHSVLSDSQSASSLKISLKELGTVLSSIDSNASGNKLVQMWEQVNAAVQNVTRSVREYNAEQSALGNMPKTLDNIINRSTQLKQAVEASGISGSGISILSGQLEKLRIESESLKLSLSNLDPSNAEDLKRIQSEVLKLSSNFKLVERDAKIFEDVNAISKFATNIEKAKQKIEEYGQKYSAIKARPDLVAELNRLKEIANGISSPAQLKAWNAEFEKFNTKVKQAGLHTQSLGDKLKQAFSNFAQFFSASRIIYEVISKFKEMVTAVTEIDSAMVELRKVTEATDAQFDKFLTSAKKKAVELGITVTDFIKSSADFSRLGYSLNESEQLAEIASIYNRIGDIDDIEKSTQSIVSTLKAFYTNTDDVAGSATEIIDKFNEVGNNYAITSEGIGDAFQRSAAALAAANNTIDESIALIVAANNVVQDPDSVGTMWKTVSMRIRGAKTELEEAGLETENMAVSTASLRDTIKAITNIDGKGGFDILTDSGAFKSTYDIILGIAEVWDELGKSDPVGQSALLELLAGKRQGNALVATLTNIKDMQAALVTSQESSGSAMAEYEKQLDSIETKTAQFAAAFQSFSDAVIDSDFIKAIVDFGTKALTVITSIIEKFGLFPSLLAVVGAGFSLMGKNLISFNQVANGLGGIAGHINILGQSIPNLINNFNALNSAGYSVKDSLIGAFDSIDTQALMKFNAEIQNGGSKVEAYKKHISGMSKETREAAVSIAKGEKSINDFGIKAQIAGVKAKIAAVGVKVLNVAINMLVSWGIGLAIQALVDGLMSIGTAAEEASQKAKEAAESALEVARSAQQEEAELQNLIDKYKELASAEYIDAGTREEIRDLQKEIVHLVEGETQGLDLVNGRLDDQLMKLKQIQLEEAKRNRSDYIAAYSSAQNSSDSAYIRDKSDVKHLSFLADWYGKDLYVSGWDSKVEDILENIGGVSVEKDWNFGTFTDIAFDVDGAQEYYDILTSCIEALEQNANYYHQDSAVYNKLVSMRKGYEEYLNTLDEATTQLVNSAITIEGLELDISGQTINSIDTFNTYRDKLIEAVLKNEDLAQALTDGKATKDSIETLIDNSLVNRFPDFYNEWKVNQNRLEKIKAVKVKFSTTPDIDDKIDKLTNDELDIACKLIAGEADYSSFEQLQAAIANEINPYDYFNLKQATEELKKYKKLLNDPNYGLLSPEHTALVESELAEGENLEDTPYGKYNNWLKNNAGVRSKYGNVDLKKQAKLTQYRDLNLASISYDGNGNATNNYSKSDLKELDYIGISLKNINDTMVAINDTALTTDGALRLGLPALDEYVNTIFNLAGEDWTLDEIMRLDAEGIEMDGVRIKNLIADIGETAGFTQNKMTSDMSVLEGYFREYERYYDAMTSTYKDKLKEVWDSEGFKDTKKSLTELSKTVDGITAESLKELVEESDVLGELLYQDGLSAEFLANIFQTELTDGSGFELITEDALKLNTALEGMTRQFDEVSEAKARYDLAMSAGEKDDNFKSFADAYAKLNEEFAAGTINSNAFWAASEFIFGEDQLQEWGYNADKIYSEMQKNAAVFKDAESAGAGFLSKLHQISKDGKILNDDGTIIAEIQKFSDGSYDFNVDALHLDELAEKMGLSKEAVLSCLEALSMWGDVDYYNIEDVLNIIEEIGLSADSLDGTAINVSALTDQLLTLGYTNKDIYDLLSELQGLDGISLINAESEADSLATSFTNLGLIGKDGVTLNVNAEGISNLLSELNFTKDEAETIITKISELDNVTLTNAQGEAQTLDDAIAHIDTLTFATVEGELDDVTTEITDVTTAADTLYSKLQKIDGTTVTVSVKLDVKSSILKSLGLEGFADGTQNAPDGDALVGEEGEELIKSGDKAYLAGTNGAEIVHLNKGDIVYTAEETKKIKRGSSKFIGHIPAYSGGYDGGATGRINPSKKYQPVITTKSEATSAKNSSTVKEGETEFERQYKYHQHLLKMDQESVEDYLDWLVVAYKEAYKTNQIDLNDFYKYAEEVYTKSKELFDDFINDIEHNIDLINSQNSKIVSQKSLPQIIAYYREMQTQLHEQANQYREQGLEDDHELIQDLQKQWWDAEENIANTITSTYDRIVSSIENSIDLAKRHMDDFITVYDDGSAEEFSNSIVSKYRNIQSKLHEEAEALRALGYSEDSAEIQDLQKQWWDAEEAKNDSLREIFDRRLELSEDYIERSKLLGWENGDTEIKARERILNWMSSDYYKSLFESEEEWQKAYLEQLEGYNDAVMSTIDKIHSDYSDAIDKINKEIDKQITREKALLDVKTKQYDAINRLTEAQHEADKAIADSRIAKAYLSDREYDLIYNEEDYAAVSKVIDDIDEDISLLTKNFNRQIENAYANGQEYLIENITAEYERQVELKMQELAIAQAELEVTKKQTELNNILAERNIRQLVERNGKFEWEWVADTDKVRAATEALSDAEYQYEKAKDEKQQQINLNRMQENIDDFTDEQARNNKLVEQLGDTIDNIKKTIDDIENPIEGLTIDVKNLKEKGVVNFSKAIDQMVAKLGSVAINSASTAKQTTQSGFSSSSYSYGSGGSSSRVTYDSSIDYMAQAQSAIKRGDDKAAANYLAKRDAKIDGEGLSYKKESLSDVKKKMGYASGTTHATKGWHEVDENGGETYITSDGKFHNFEGGEYVFNTEKTQALDQMATMFAASMKNGMTMPISKNNVPNSLSILQDQNNGSKGNKYSFGDIVINNPADFDAFTRQLTNAIKKKTV